MNKNLNDYFDSMHKDIDNKQVFNEDGLRSLIDKQDNISGNETGKGKSLIKSGAFKMGIISSVIIASVLSWQLFFNTSEPKGNETVREISPENAISENQVEEAGEALIEPADTTTEIKKIPILYLSAEELKPFGIELTDSSLVYIHECKYIADHDGRNTYQRKLKQDGYNIQEGEYYRIKKIFNGYNNRQESIVKYTGWDKKAYTKTYPACVFVYQRDSLGGCNSYVDFRLSMPFFDSRIAEIEEIIYSKNITYIQDRADERPKFMDVNDFKDFYIRQMVPVHYKVKFKNSWVGGYFWFVPNKEFLSKLSPDKASLVKEYYHETDIVNYSEEVEARIKADKSEPVYYKLSKERFEKTIQLDDRQAKALGIRFDGENMLIYRQLLTDTSTYDEKYKSKGYSAGLNLIKNELKLGIDLYGRNNILQYDGNEADSGLILDFGVCLFSYDYQYYDKEYKMYIPKRAALYIDGFNGSTTYNNFSPESLVPVSYEVEFIKNNDPKQKYNYCINLWYLPTPAFLSRLSPENRERVIKELELIDAIDKDLIQPAEACAELEDESLLGICQLSSVNIDNVKVYPNPAKNIANIKFVLNSPCKVSITLFKLTGRLEKEIIIDKQYKKGKHFLNLDLSDCGQDIYLLVVTTEKGDEVVRKVMKE